MAFTLYNDFVVRMISELPMCLPQIIMQEMQRASIEFFSATGVWRQDLTAMDVVSGQANYTLTLPSQSQLQQVQTVKVNTTPTTLSFDSLPPMDVHAYHLNEAQTALVFYPWAVPQDSITGGLQVNVMLIPTWDATGVPSQYINRYARGLMARTKYNLMSMAGKPWSNPQVAMKHLALYDAEMAEATRDKYVGNIQASMMMDIPDI